MNDKTESTLRELQLASLGKLLSGYTHELKNHLAIINESSGLMGDLLDMMDNEDDQTAKRFRKIIASISERVTLANSSAKHLNSLAHRMDMPTSIFNVNDLLTEQLALIDRFAKLKSISLEKKFQEDIPAIFNNPSLLQFIVFSLVIEFIGKLDNGGVIEISSQAQGQDINVTIEAIGPQKYTATQGDSSQMTTILEFATEKTDIGLKRSQVGTDRLKITLTLPSV